MPIWYDLIFESILPTLLLHLVSICHFESNFLFLFFFFFSFHLTIAQISPDSVEFFHVISYRLWNSNYFFFGNPVPLKITKAYIRLILKFVNGIIFRAFCFSRITKIRTIRADQPNWWRLLIRKRVKFEGRKVESKSGRKGRKDTGKEDPMSRCWWIRTG